MNTTIKELLETIAEHRYTDDKNELIYSQDKLIAVLLAKVVNNTYE